MNTNVFLIIALLFSSNLLFGQNHVAGMAKACIDSSITIVEDSNGNVSFINPDVNTILNSFNISNN